LEIFRLFGTISINKAKALADLKAVNAAGASFGTKFNNTMKKIGNFGKKVFAGLAVAAGAVFVGAIKKAADFELAMAKVNAITGATAEEFEALEEKAKQLGLETAQTMTDIAAGMEAFARAGFTATEIVVAMDGAVALAESQVMDLAEAVRITGAVLNGMNMEVSESERVANALAATASSSATTVSSLAESMKYLAPVAAAMNMELEEALTVVAKLGDAGLTGGRATRALATALKGLAEPTEEAAAALEKLGIDTFDAEGNFIGIIELAGQLEESFNDLGYTAEERLGAMESIFAGASNAMSILVNEGRSDLEAYQESITGTSVAFEQQAAMLETVSGQWQILKGSIELLLVTIGGPMLTAIQGFITNTLIPWVNRMTEAAEGTSIFEEAIKKIIAPFEWMINNGQKVKNALLVIGAGLAAVVFYTNPILAITAALAGLVAVLTGNDGLPKTVSGMHEFNAEIDQMMTSLGGASKGTIVGFVSDYYEALTDVINQMKKMGDVSREEFGDIVKELFNLQSAVLQLEPDEMAEAWVLGVDVILSKFGETNDAFETLRIGYIDTSEAAQVAAEGNSQVTETINNAKDAIDEVNRVYREWLASQEEGVDDTNDTVVAVSELRKEYDDLMIALNAAEEGSYEYAMALQNLEKFHNSLADAAEYLADGDAEVSVELQALIDLTMQYYREQEEATKAAEKGARTMDDLKESFIEMKAAMEGAEVGSVEYADALDDVQSQADMLMNIVDDLQAKNIAVSQTIWDQIDALDEQGATIRLTAKEQEKANEIAEDAAEALKLKKEADEAAERAAKEHAAAVKAQIKGWLNLAKTLVKDVVGAYKKMREEMEDYAQSVRDIQEEFAENELDAAESKDDALESEALRHARKMEDIEKDYERAKADVRAEDYEDAQDYLDKLADIEEDYRQDKQDADIRNTRELEDIDKDYTDTMKDNAKERINALDEEGKKFNENRTTIFDAIKSIRDKAAEYAAEKIVENWIDGIASSWAGMAGEAEGASKAVGIFESVTSPAIVTAFTNILGILTPLLIGFGAFNQQIRDANKLITEGVFNQQYGGGIVWTDQEGNEYVKDEEGNWVAAPWSRGYVPSDETYSPNVDYGSATTKGATNNNSNVNVEINYGGVSVNSEQDAEALARETYNLYNSRLRAEGVRA
jgi:TP901 family phage tail tape measure protein